MTNSSEGGSDTTSSAPYFRTIVLKTESEDEFMNLVEKLEQDIQPKNFIEELYVNEVAALTWEIIRYRRCKTAIITNANHIALKNILAQIRFKPGSSETLAAEKLAYEWFYSQKAKEGIAALLKEAGRDETAVEAEAFRLKLNEIEKIERLLASAEARRDKALRSIGQYRESFARKLQQSTESVLAADAASSVVHSGPEN
jgi:hypothetical protein